MLHKWGKLFREYPPLLSKNSLDSIANPVQQVLTRKKHPAVGRARRHGQAATQRS